jgi:hypothetical protein
VNDSARGLAGLVVFGLMVLSVVLRWRRRPPDEVVTHGRARGRPGLAVHPWRGHWVSGAVGWLLLGLLVLWGLLAMGSNSYAAGLLLVCALPMCYVGWCRATGRAGDGTITLTPAGIHQRYAGSEVFIDWQDVRGLVTTPTDFIVETSHPVVPVQHMLPLVGGRRGVVTQDAVALPRRGLPPLPFQEMVELYATSPAARDLLGTDEAVQRTRGMLTTIPNGLHSRGRWRHGRAVGDSPDHHQPVSTIDLVVDVVLVLAMGWVLWVTAGAEAQRVAAATGNGRPGVMVIDGMRPARGADIPVGTFTDRDGTVASEVAWQDRPATVGDRKEGVRVGNRAWEPEVRLGLWGVLVDATVVGLFVWRVLALIRHWRGRRPSGP